MTFSVKSPRAISVATTLVCCAIYLRALSCGFVGLDDPVYVLDNSAIRSLDGDFIATVFTQPHAGWWMPLTWISLAVDYRIWGLNPLGYHLTNILLHSFNAGLVTLIADKLLQERFARGAYATRLYPVMLLLAGLLWGIHPLRVESVAWVTERKDVLNGLFTLASILCYLSYARKREAGDAGVEWSYRLSLLLFICSLMAKSVSVVLPFLLLIVDWYPLERLRRGRVVSLLIEKVPFFAISAAMALLTVMIAAQRDILIHSDTLPLVMRLLISGNALFEYCRLLLFPVGIIPLYVIPNPIPYTFAVNSLAMVAFTCACVYAANRCRCLLAAWLCFVIPLLPVLAFFQNGDQSHASRFTYLPSLAPSILMAVVLVIVYTRAAERWQGYSRLVAAFTLVLLVGYSSITQRLIGVWQDTGTMWSRVIERQPLGRAHQERGLFYLEKGRFVAAVEDFSAAIAIAAGLGMPQNYNLIAHRGEALRLAGRYDEAARDFTVAIMLFPNPVYYYHRGLSLKALGNDRAAAEDFKQAGNDSGPLEWYP